MQKALKKDPTSIPPRLAIINCPNMSLETMAYLFKHDSTYGPFPAEIKVDRCTIYVEGFSIRTIHEKSYKNINWNEFGVNAVIEANDINPSDPLDKYEYLTKHIILLSPIKEVPLFAFGVNHELFCNKMKIIAMVRSPAACAAPLLKIINEAVGIKEGVLTTICGYLSNQSLIDRADNPIHCGRSTTENILQIPSTSAGEITNVIPCLKGRILSSKYTVPIANAALCEITLRLSKKVGMDFIRAAIRKASETSYKSIVGYSQTPLVSSDVRANGCSAVFDSIASKQLKENIIKVVAWYDYDWSVAHRVLEMIYYMNMKCN